MVVENVALRRVVAMLVAAYPWTHVDPATPDVYAVALADVSVDELEAAVVTLIRTSRRFASVAEIRDLIAETRLGLPSPVEAWEAVQLIVRTPRMNKRCPSCNGSGLADTDFDVLCPECGGSADVEVAVTPLLRALPEPVARALRVVGGSTAVGAADRPEIIRAQFIKAYEQLRREAVRETNLGRAAIASRGGTAALREGESR